MSERVQRLCWNCDAVVPGKVQFCPNCNSIQKEIAQEMLAEPRTRGTSNMTGFFVMVGVVILLAVGLVVFLNRPKVPTVAAPGDGDWRVQPAETRVSPNEITPDQHAPAPGSREN